MKTRQISSISLPRTTVVTGNTLQTNHKPNFSENRVFKRGDKPDWLHATHAYRFSVFYLTNCNTGHTACSGTSSTALPPYYIIRNACVSARFTHQRRAFHAPPRRVISSAEWHF